MQEEGGEIFPRHGLRLSLGSKGTVNRAGYSRLICLVVCAETLMGVIGGYRQVLYKFTSSNLRSIDS